MREFRNVNRLAFGLMAAALLGASAASALFSALNIRNLLLRYVILYAFQFGVPLAVFIRRNPMPLRERFRWKAASPASFAVAIAFAVLVQPALMLLSAVTSLFSPNVAEQAMAAYREVPFWMSLIAVALIPAFCEEMAFRGAYLTGCKRLPVFAAAALCGLAFGMMHMNLQQAVYAACFGFLCSLVAVACNSVWPSVAVHFVVNASQLTLARALSEGWFGEVSAADGQATGTLQSILALLPAGVLSLAAAFGCLYLLFRLNGKTALLKNRRAEEEPMLSKEERLPGMLWFLGAVAVFAGGSLMILIAS